MTTIPDLLAKQQRLTRTIALIESAIRDMQSARSEAHLYTAYAASWAAVLLAADILKQGLSLQNKTAAAAFTGIDKSIDVANRFLTAVHQAPITRKSDALALLDPELRKVNGLAGDIQKVSQWLTRMGTDKSAIARSQIGVAVSLAKTMTEDVLLMLQAGNDQTRMWNTNSLEIQKAYQRLQGVKSSLTKTNLQLQVLLAEAERWQRTA